MVQQSSLALIQTLAFLISMVAFPTSTAACFRIFRARDQAHCRSPLRKNCLSSRVWKFEPPDRHGAGLLVRRNRLASPFCSNARMSTSERTGRRTARNAPGSAPLRRALDPVRGARTSTRFRECGRASISKIAAVLLKRAQLTFMERLPVRTGPCRSFLVLNNHK